MKTSEESSMSQETVSNKTIVIFHRRTQNKLSEFAVDNRKMAGLAHWELDKAG